MKSWPAFSAAVLPLLICMNNAAGPTHRKKEGPDAPVIDVCGALQKIDKLNGSVTAVRGYYRFGMELGGLYGRNCPKKLILDHAVRPQAFDLRFSLTSSQSPTVDQKELDSASDKLIAEKDTRNAIQVTVIGVIRARRSNLADIHGRKARMFGHLGVYPAQIEVRAVRDVTVVDAPGFPSNMDPDRHF